MDSPCESESSLDGGSMLPPSPVSREQLQKRIESLTQQNKVLKVELDTCKMRAKVLQEENLNLRHASVIIQAKAEQEEEYISNTLLKKIQSLKKEKETLAHHFEREEECLTNDLSRKLDQLRQEKCKLEQTLEQEQECLVNKLMRKIEKLEAETSTKQLNLEQLRREMIELENTLEQEQEALVNKLWKRMDKLESEKRSLQVKLDQPVSDPTSLKDITNENGDTASNLSAHIEILSSEVSRLRSKLAVTEQETTEKIQQFAQDEKCIREENLRLQRKLQLEVERREALSRHLSESESSLEMEEERYYNESVLSFGGQRQRTISSPIPHSPSNSRPLSPGIGVGGGNQGVSQSTNRCFSCGQILGIQSFFPLTNVFHPISSSSPPVHGSGRRTSERFIKPAIPTPSLGLNTSAPNVFSSGANNINNNNNNNNNNNINNSGSNNTSGSGILHFCGIGGGGGGNTISSGSNNNNYNNILLINNNNNNNSLSTSTSSLSSHLSSSMSSVSQTNNNNINSISFSGNSAFAQPASPMDTSVCKD